MTEICHIISYHLLRCPPPSMSQRHLTVYIDIGLQARNILYRVATNLEYSGISLNMENSRNSHRILCNSAKNCNKQIIFSLSFRYLCKTAVDWVNRIIKNRRGQSAVVTCYIAGVDVE